MCDLLWQKIKYNRDFHVKPYLFENENCQGSLIPYEHNVLTFKNVKSCVIPENFDVTFYQDNKSFVSHRIDVQDVVVQDSALELVKFSNRYTQNTLDTHQAFKVVPSTQINNYFQHAQRHCQQFNTPPPEYISWSDKDCLTHFSHEKVQKDKNNNNLLSLSNNKSMSCSCGNSSSTNGYFPDWAFWVIFGLVILAILIFLFFIWRSYRREKYKVLKVESKKNRS